MTHQNYVPRFVIDAPTPRIVTHYSPFEICVVLLDETGSSLKDLFLIGAEISVSLSLVYEACEIPIDSFKIQRDGPTFSIYMSLGKCNLDFLKRQYAEFRIKIDGIITRMLGLKQNVQPAISNKILITGNDSKLEYYQDIETARECKIKSKHQRSDAFDEDVRIFLIENQSKFGLFGIVWDSSFYILEYLQSHYDDLELHDKSILELGSATGLLSIFCCKYFHPQQVVITDTDMMIELIHRNLEENDLMEGQTVVVKEHEWGKIYTDPSSLSATEWQHFEYDFIIGSDLIFDPTYWEDLWSSLDHFAKPHTRVLLSFRLRHELEMGFFGLPRSSGWNILDVSYANPGLEGDFKIFIMTRK